MTDALKLNQTTGKCRDSRRIVYRKQLSMDGVKVRITKKKLLENAFFDIEYCTFGAQNWLTIADGFYVSYHDYFKYLFSIVEFYAIICKFGYKIIFTK